MPNNGRPQQAYYGSLSPALCSLVLGIGEHRVARAVAPLAARMGLWFATDPRSAMEVIAEGIRNPTEQVLERMVARAERLKTYKLSGHPREVAVIQQIMLLDQLHKPWERLREMRLATLDARTEALELERAWEAR